jgi:hypothetical protein
VGASESNSNDLARFAFALAEEATESRAHEDRALNPDKLVSPEEFEARLVP